MLLVMIGTPVCAVQMRFKPTVVFSNMRTTDSLFDDESYFFAELENEYPDQVRNQCFEISIENNEMQFEYQLRNGVTTIMNVTFLMKRMGIVE